MNHRDLIEQIIASVINRAQGNPMPHMSGDPRGRLPPHIRSIVSVAAAAVMEVMRNPDPLYVSNDPKERAIQYGEYEKGSE